MHMQISERPCIMQSPLLRQSTAQLLVIMTSQIKSRFKTLVLSNFEEVVGFYMALWQNPRSYFSSALPQEQIDTETLVRERPHI